MAALGEPVRLERGESGESRGRGGWGGSGPSGRFSCGPERRRRRGPLYPDPLLGLGAGRCSREALVAFERSPAPCVLADGGGNSVLNDLPTAAGTPWVRTAEAAFSFVNPKSKSHSSCSGLFCCHHPLCPLDLIRTLGGQTFPAATPSPPFKLRPLHYFDHNLLGFQVAFLSFCTASSHGEDV